MNNASKEEVDVYTQKLNKVLSYTVSQKNTGVTAQGSLLTIMKGSEYQPAVALRFEGEKDYQAVIENMSEKDLENYHALLDSFKPAIAEFKKLVEAIQSKGKEIKPYVKF